MRIAEEDKEHVVIIFQKWILDERRSISLVVLSETNSFELGILPSLSSGSSS